MIRRPDGPDGERWVLFGGDRDLFGPVDRAEDWNVFFRPGERGPGVPDWTGFAHTGDTNRWHGEALGLFTWFDGGRWHQSGAVLDRIPEDGDPRWAEDNLTELDPVHPWRHGRMTRVSELIGSDEEVLQQMRPDGPHELQQDVAGDVDLTALTRVMWNAVVTDEIATDPTRLTTHLRHIAARLRTNEPSEDQLTEAVEIAAHVRRLVGSPLPLDLQPGPREFLADLAARDADALARIHDLVRLWGEAVAGEIAAEIPAAQRRFRLDEWGLYARTEAGAVRLLGQDPGRLVLLDLGPEHDGGAKPIASLLWPDYDGRGAIPQWIPHPLLVAVSNDRARAVSWTTRGRWRQRVQQAEPLAVWPAEWQIGTDQTPRPAGALQSAAGLTPRRGFLGRQRPSAEEAAEVRRAVAEFLRGAGVLAAGAPPAYPVVPDVEPVARQYARAMAQHQFRRRLAGQGAAAAISLIITGIPTPPPPLPPADLDVIAGLEGEGPELVAAAVARLGVPDPDETELVNAVTEATGLDPRTAGMRVRSALHQLRYARPHNPGGRQAREALRTFAHHIRATVTDQQIADASRMLAVHGCWPEPVPADWDPLTSH